jgi:hypothetical protein
MYLLCVLVNWKWILGTCQWTESVEWLRNNAVVNCKIFKQFWTVHISFINGLVIPSRAHDFFTLLTFVFTTRHILIHRSIFTRSRHPLKINCINITILFTLYMDFNMLYNMQVNMRSALFWDITQRSVVILYRRFGTSYLSTLRNIMQKRSSHLHRGGRLKSRI